MSSLFAHNGPHSWLSALRRYILASLVLHAGWEVAQLPLYTIWTSGTPPERWFAVMHCTLGDVLIASVALIGALTTLGSERWPQQTVGRVAAATIATGFVYTVYSEWLNVTVRKSWAYAEAMPTVPPLGTGLAPLLQWLVVPALVLWFATRTAR